MGRCGHRGADVDERTIDLRTATRTRRGAVDLADAGADGRADSPGLPRPRRAAEPLTARPAAAGLATAERPARRWRRRKYLAVAVASGAVSLLVGMGIGGAGSSGRIADADRRTDAALQQVHDADAAIADAHHQMAQAQQAAQDAASARAKTEAALAAAKTAADAASARATDLQAQLSAAQAAAATSAKASLGASSAPSSKASTGSGRDEQEAEAPRSSSVGSSVSFANCSEARAAGATPVRVGDPGYSRKLDRDGDGVGCE